MRWPSSARGQQFELQTVELAIKYEWSLVICVIHAGAGIRTNVECFTSLKCERYGVRKIGASDLDAMAVAQGLCAWTLLHGAVTSEIFGQLGPLPDAEALFVVLLAAGRSALLTDPAS